MAVEKVDQPLLPGARSQLRRRLVPRPRESTDHGRRTEHHSGGADGQRDRGAERPHGTTAERRQQQCPRIAHACKHQRSNTSAGHQKFDRTLVNTESMVNGSVAS